jgi:hypothetical protein
MHTGKRSLPTIIISCWSWLRPCSDSRVERGSQREGRLAYHLLGTTSPAPLDGGVNTFVPNSSALCLCIRYAAVVHYSLFVYVCVYMCARERESERDWEWETERLFLFGVNFYFEGSLDGSCNKSRENNGSNEFLRVQQRSRSHACVACKAKRLQ